MMQASRCLLLLFTALVLGTLCEAAKAKAEEKAQTSTPTKDQPAFNMFGDLMDFSKLEVVDWLRSGAVLVGFIVAFLGDKKGETRVWQLAESIFLGLYGLALYFFPSLLMGYLSTSKIDHMHVFLTQGCGLAYTGLAVISHRQYHANSKDPQVTGGWLLSRVVGFMFLMFVGVYNKLALAKESQRYTDQFVAFAGLAFGLLWIGSLVKLWQHYSNGNSGGQRSSSRGRAGSVLNQHILVSIMLALPLAIMYYGMPSFAMKSYVSVTFDKIHLSLLTTIGGISLTYVLQEMAALQYDSDTDKRHFFIGRLVALGMTFPLIFLNQYKHGLYSQGMLFCLVPMWLFQGGNSFCAAFLRNKDKNY